MKTPQWIGRWQQRYERVQNALLDRPPISRGYAAYQRYYALGMHHLAGSVIYFGILTLFPFLALLFVLVSRVLSAHPDLRRQGTGALAEELGVDADIGIQLFAAQARESVRAITATVGVLGVCYAGRLWVDAYRRALQVVWDTAAPPPANIVWRYARDYLAFAVVVAAMLVLVALGLLATAGPYRVLAVNGHSWPGWAVVLARLAAAALAIGWAGFICGGLYHRLGRAPRTAATRAAAVLAGVALAGLVVGGLLVLKHVFADPVYGIVVAILGLMLWVSAAARITLSLAVWAQAKP